MGTTGRNKQIGPRRRKICRGRGSDNSLSDQRFHAGRTVADVDLGRVLPAAAADGVAGGGVAGIEEVVTVAGVEEVQPPPAEELIIAIPAEQRVAAGQADEDV